MIANERALAACRVCEGTKRNVEKLVNGTSPSSDKKISNVVRRDVTGRKNPPPSPWGARYANLALLAVLADCILTPVLVKRGIITDAISASLVSIWPKNIDLVEQLRAIHAPVDIINSITTSNTIAAIIIIACCVVRVSRELIYDYEVIFPLRLFLFALILSIYLPFWYIYLLNFNEKFDIYSVNLIYNVSINCIILSFSLFSCAFFLSETFCQVIRFVGVLSDRIGR